MGRRFKSTNRCRKEIDARKNCNRLILIDCLNKKKKKLNFIYSISIATFVQCQEHAKPLFKQLSSGELHDEIREHLYRITVCVQEKEYVKAHDAYILLAIGMCVCCVFVQIHWKSKCFRVIFACYLLMMICHSSIDIQRQRCLANGCYYGWYSWTCRPVHILCYYF